MIKTVLIVDPIFRGSRLFYSWLVASGALKYGYKPVVFTRTNSKTEHFHEIFGDDQPEIHEVVNLPEKFWYGKISYEGIKSIFENIHKHVNIHEPSLIFFAGVNELDPQLFRYISENDLGYISKVPLVLTDYDATFLLRDIACNRPRRIMRRFLWSMRKYKSDRIKLARYKSIFKQFSNVKVTLPDERINEKKYSKRPEKLQGVFTFLPDPPYPDKAGQAATTVKLLKDKSLIYILLVGIQSGRKGIMDVIRAASETYPGHEHIQFVISGRLADEISHLRSRLQQLKDRIIWHDDYVSNLVLQDRFNAADYVMLPYTTDFNGSSGVLAMAARSGKPLITTEHGVIGYRTRINRMGYTYKSGNIGGLIRILSELKRLKDKEYNLLSRACREYSCNNSIDAYQKGIFQSLSG